MRVKSSRSGSILVLTMLVFGLFCGPFSETASARSELGFNDQLQKQVEATFGGSSAKSKVRAYRDQITLRARQLVQKFLNNQALVSDSKKFKLTSTELTAVERSIWDVVVRGDEALLRSLPAKSRKIADEVLDETGVELYGTLLRAVDKLSLMDPASSEHKLSAAKILEIDYSLKVEGPKRDWVEMSENITTGLIHRKIIKEHLITDEASNLGDPATGKFYTHDELAQLVREGVDLSTLDPGASTFWMPLDIEKTDVRERYFGGYQPLSDGKGPEFPTENKVYYKSLRRTQSKPKFNVTFKDAEGKESTIKLKIAFETHSEPTAAALTSILGFHHDVNKHVSKLKLVLGKRTYNEFREEVYSYFKGYDLDKYVQSKGRDGEGNFVVFHQATFEGKVKGAKRAGPWAFGKNGHKGVRETRALAILNMWIANEDVKEADNNKLVVRTDKDGTARLFHLQHDLGFTFGSIYRETPGQFSWRLVDRETDKEIKLTYRQFQDNSGFEHITIADLRWATRLIARLSRAQIAEAVSIGGWPESVQHLLVEKLISRRNDLVRVAKLEGERQPDGNRIEILSYDPKITTADGVVVQGELKVKRLPDYPQNFDSRTWDEVAPILRKAREGVVGLLARLGSAPTNYEIPGEMLGLDPFIVPTVVFNVSREIDENPAAKTVDERFLLKDRMEMGFRLGAGFVVGGELSYVHAYTLVYAKKSAPAAQYGNHFVYNLLLPYTVAAGKLPEKHVIMTESFVEGGGVLRVGGAPFTIGLKGTASRVFLSRSVVSTTQPDSIRMYKDTSTYNELASKIYAQLLILRLPLSQVYAQNGMINRKVYVMGKTVVADPSSSAARALNAVVAQGEFKSVPQFSKVEEISSKFYESVSKISLLGLYGAKNQFRRDNLKVTAFDKKGEEVSNSYEVQINSLRSSSWKFLDNGESVSNTVTLVGDVDHSKGTVKNPLIRMSYAFVDQDTRTKELTEGYLGFINNAANDSRFIDFTPSLHTSNGFWGRLNALVNIVYNRDAIRALLSLDEGTFVARLKIAYLGAPSFTALKRSRSLLNSIADARRAGETSIEAMTELVRGLKGVVFKNTGRIGGYDGHILSVLNEMLGEKKVFISAMIMTPPDRENKLPGGVPYYNRRGPLPSVGLAGMIFGQTTPMEIYYGF